MTKLNRKQYTIFAIIIVFVLSWFIYNFWLNDSANELVISDLEGESKNQILEETISNDKNETEDEKNTQKVVVYISGAVSTPGVFTLPEGSRVYQGIEMAGGKNEDALTEFLNLAALLQDGMHIHIPSEGEDMDQVNDDINMTFYQEENSLINVNTANNNLLESLPGIGTVRAQNIIDYRENNGIFSTTDQIMEVNGIGQGIFSEIKELITVN
ncbi:helix-hairpin-helix domain-containing protein [Natranaerobius trueperi]|uniref:Helix-hairpin-helix DNA-binding motif class 1 domain-containing protein n=1 Tax=Natranaerobius trueperi TaxID=759412 RepID=A0A226BY33_9FIRM|nr:helix-hairpin-helix domain-containing protein [Natranaerobius trueperi]OWZ83938.1 hypothetical protein CDO51_06005 [Natranaerobius trueperi]